MTIALDYDDTYTKDPVFWRAVIDLAIIAGHTVIMVTCRYKNHEERIELLPPTVPIFYTGRESKLKYMKALKLGVDVWIDDDPFAIVDTF